MQGIKFPEKQVQKNAAFVQFSEQHDTDNERNVGTGHCPVPTNWYLSYLQVLTVGEGLDPPGDFTMVKSQLPQAIK